MTLIAPEYHRKMREKEENNMNINKPVKWMHVTGGADETKIHHNCKLKQVKLTYNDSSPMGEAESQSQQPDAGSSRVEKSG
jgi:hypothetical protein